MGGLTLDWIGGVRSYRLGLIEDLCHLRKGSYEQIQNARIKSFKSLQFVRSFAKRVDDRELIARVDLVFSWNPDALLSSLKSLKGKAEKREGMAKAPPAQLALATVHKAKGLEWKEVWLADDFIDLCNGEAHDSQEVNMLYVAVTRCKQVLHLPSSLSDAYVSQSESVAMIATSAAQGQRPLQGLCPFCGQQTS